MEKQKSGKVSRRRFFQLTTAGTIAAAVPRLLPGADMPVGQEKPATNIADAMKYPRGESSMPGRYPGVVARITHEGCIDDNRIVAPAAYRMIAEGMLALTGKARLKSAWRVFVRPGEKIGLKINPIGGPLLSTSHEAVKAVISQLEEAGIRKEDILIWDRREEQMVEAGFTGENYPGIKIIGTETKDEKGSFYDTEGKLYSERMIDKDWYYWADVEGEYDAYTMPYMVNGGKYSYFTKICTQMVDKIINIPIMKNAGSSVTLAMKNLAFGSVTNTGRLHKQLWAETCAFVCAFPPLRDKVVLNILDGIRGCFDGGPAANPQFFTNYKTILLSTDPVAVDRIGYEMILRKRIEEKIQKEEAASARNFMNLAQELMLGVADLDRIEVREVRPA